MSDTKIFHQGVVAPLDKHNVDTDQIIPKQFLSSVSRDGFGEALFYGWRYQEDGNENPEFILNLPEYRDASILISRDNFGCGSSREHAPWALQQFGFQVVIAPSFADIFYGNCINNQLLPIVLDETNVEQLFKRCEQGELNLVIDLEAQELRFDDKAIAFDIAPGIKNRMLKGLDFIGVSEAFAEQIAAYEAAQVEREPWM